MYQCPSEISDTVRYKNGVPVHYPLNYAVNQGIWLTFSPANGQGGVGAFRPVQPTRHADMVDGTSNTVGLAEVKAYTPYYRNAGLVNPAIPIGPGAICNLGGGFKVNTGHTEWVDGRVHQTGFTILFAPNTEIRCSETVDGVTSDYGADWTNMQEGKSGSVVTYAAVTSRSYHSGGVQVQMMDGSTQFVAENINLRVWRALSTRKGKEPEGRID